MNFDILACSCRYLLSPIQLFDQKLREQLSSLKFVRTQGKQKQFLESIMELKDPQLAY